jgi:hypothetical protein
MRPKLYSNVCVKFMESYLSSYRDRKESLTPVSSSSGSGSTAKWTELNWAMKISDDSIIYAVVTSGGVNIGRVDLNPSELISIPVNHDKLTEV